jgi:hypothetical protein
MLSIANQPCTLPHCTALNELKAMEESRKAAAAKLVSSQKAEAQTKIQPKKDKYAGMFTEAAEAPVKHSKIWLALNPQPLHFQTADARCSRFGEGFCT